MLRQVKSEYRPQSMPLLPGAPRDAVVTRLPGEVIIRLLHTGVHDGQGVPVYIGCIIIITILIPNVRLCRKMFIKKVKVKEPSFYF